MEIIYTCALSWKEGIFLEDIALPFDLIFLLLVHLLAQSLSEPEVHEQFAKDQANARK